MKKLILFIFLFVSALVNAAEGNPDFYNSDNTLGFCFIKGVADQVEVSPWSMPGSEYVSVYTGDIVIPETVDYNGVTYRVTKIGFGAFSESTITSIVIPASILVIEDYAFEKCYNLTKIVFLGTTPPVLGKDVFRKLTLSSILVYVPDGCASIYSSFGGYDGFPNILTTSINTININKNNNQYIYNMNGQIINRPKSGIYIVNGKKIVFK